MDQRRSFAEDFKRDAVRLCIERGNLAQTARELGISETVLYRWKKLMGTAAKNPFPGHGNARDQEMAQLRRDLRRAQEENEILKKTVGIFTTRPR